MTLKAFIYEQMFNPFQNDEIQTYPFYTKHILNAELLKMVT